MNYDNKNGIHIKMNTLNEKPIKLNDFWHKQKSLDLFWKLNSRSKTVFEGEIYEYLFYVDFNQVNIIW